MKLNDRGELELELGEAVVVKLRDGYYSNPQRSSVKARMLLNENGQIEISVDGYGDKVSEPGYGAPILVEKYRDRLLVRCWSDINSEDPTHLIDFEGAKESARKEEEAPAPVNVKVKVRMSKEPPRESGWYWFYHPGLAEPVAVRVTCGPDIVGFTVRGIPPDVSANDEGCEWCKMEFPPAYKG